MQCLPIKKVFILLVMLSTSIYSNNTFEFVCNKTNGALDKKFIKKMVDVFKVDVFFETGTYNARTTINALPYFKDIHTVELHCGLFKEARNKLVKYENVHIYNGRSDDVIKMIIPTIKGTILFWLDAHYSGKGTALSVNDFQVPEAFTAIREELKVIKEAGVRDCVILIDDVTEFGSEISDKKYMGCWAYPTLQWIQNDLLKINPNFELAILGNKLLVYDKHKYNPLISETVIACTKTRLYDGHNLNDKELIELEEKIMNASLEERKYIEAMYNNMANYKYAMFWNDLWYGLTQLGAGNYDKAREAFYKVKVRIECFDKKGKPLCQEILYNHWRIDKYLKICNQE